jgi:hypothetical protein
METSFRLSFTADYETPALPTELARIFITKLPK